MVGNLLATFTFALNTLGFSFLLLEEFKNEFP